MELIPPASRLLEVWEQGRFQTPAQRAFFLLVLAAPSVSVENLAGYRVGQRDRELLGLREQIFGSCMTGTARCPGCGQDIELDFAVADLRTEAGPDAGQLQAVQIGEYDLRFSLPTCGDLAALTANGANGDLKRQKSVLLQRCVAEARRKGEPVAADSLSEETVAALSQRMAELDPQGDIQLALTCPNCGRLWDSPLDISSYLWGELQAWALRLLQEVHLLASVYGWREADILAMNPWRRQAYLELIRQ
jgi:hypothetical protein